MPVDLSATTYFLPLVSFLLVFLVSFVVLLKTKIVENKWVQLFISFLLATLFVSIGGAREYVENVAPWFAVLIISLFFMLLLIGFVGKPLENLPKGVGIFFVVILFIVFIISGLLVFSSSIVPYLPGNVGYEGGSPEAVAFFDWLYSPRVGGAILLVIVSALVSWVLVKVK
ncbi:hypothetical protein HYZ97_03800 [Candidatus Pacearchaeota archaeon]|nr:hypothetical protein [Candidatus Pacearchaeota archaeon]